VKKREIALAVVGAASVGLLAFGSSKLSADESTCTAGNGRYQVSTTIYNEFKATIFETVLDTCTGEVVRREAVG